MSKRLTTRKIQKGAYHGILNKLKVTDFENFRRYLRRNTDNFEVSSLWNYVQFTSSVALIHSSLLWNIPIIYRKNDYHAIIRSYFTLQKLIRIVGDDIQKNETNMRMPIDREEKLAVTWQFLATGESYDGLLYQFCVHKSTIAQYIP